MRRREVQGRTNPDMPGHDAMAVSVYLKAPCIKTNREKDMLKSKSLITSVKAPPNTLQLGEFCEEFGGHFLGIMPARKTTPMYGLILLSGENESVNYGPSGSKVGGADDDNDGFSNTELLLASGLKHPAAEWARSQGPDAYLMARNEARLGFVTAPHLFFKGWHITSTQHAGDPGCAWCSNFGIGNQDNCYKGSSCRARAVRRVLVIQ